MGNKERLVGGLSIKQFAQEVRKQAKPVDFKALELGGLMKKVGAWYEVANIRKLPDHVAAKISEVKQVKGKTFVKLHKPSRKIDRLVEQLRKAGY